MTKWDLSQVCTAGSTFKNQKPINVIRHINMLTKKNHMITSITAFEKAFEKSSMTKTLSKLGIEENFLNLIKNIYKKFTDNILLNS